MWSDNLLTSIFSLNLMLYLIQKCSSAVLFNLYTPYNYSPILPAYFYAIAPNEPRIQLPNVPIAYYYQSHPVTSPVTNIYDSTPPPLIAAADVTPTPPSDLQYRHEPVTSRSMPEDLRSYIAYRQEAPLVDFYSDESVGLGLEGGPSCKLASWPDNVCDDDSAYPLETIQDILEEYNIVSPDRPADMSIESTIFPRGTDGVGDDQSTCDGESRIIYPRVARSSKNKWVYVANYDDYLQPVRVKKCSSSRSCSSRAQSTYRSKCQQNTRRLTMMAIDFKRRKPYKETFEMPVECQCTVLSSVFPTRSNRPGSWAPPSLPSNHLNMTGGFISDRSLEPRTRRRH